MPYDMPMASRGEATTLSNLCRRYEKAKKLRSMLEGRFDDLYAYFLPFHESFKGERQEDQPAMDLFDDTAVQSLQEFLASLQHELLPATAPWAAFELPRDIPPEHQLRLGEQAREQAQTIFKAIADSNFYQEVNSALGDYAISVGTMAGYPGNYAYPLRWEAIPMTKVYVDSISRVDIDVWFIPREVTLEEFKNRYPNATVPPEWQRMEAQEGHGPAKTFNVVEGLYREGALATTWVYHLFTADDDTPGGKRILDSFKYEGKGSCPLMSFRWAVDPGRVWGRGVTWSCFASARTLNELCQIFLETAEVAMTGIWTGPDDNFMNVDTMKIEPGAFVPTSPGAAQGLQNVAPNVNWQLNDKLIRDMRASIERALYTRTLGDPNKSPMKATEVVERVAEMAKLRGFAVTRFVNEFAMPAIGRAQYILRRQGAIEDLEFGGRKFPLSIVSPLVLQQRLAELQRVDQSIGLITQRFGPQIAMAIFNVYRVAQYYADQMKIPVDLLADPEVLKQAAAAMAQQQGQGQATPLLASPQAVEGEPGSPDGA